MARNVHYLHPCRESGLSISEALVMGRSATSGIVTCFNILLALFCLSKLGYSVQANPSKPLVPALYIFGDSTVDPGNNNGLETIFRANFPPYGRDFVDHKPSGRFTNGKLVTDMISGLLGLPDLLPAYLDPKFHGPEILTGASFASAGAGYYDITSLVVDVLPLGKQVENFRDYRRKLSNLIGAKNATRIISKGLFLISMGTNDFVNNYYTNSILRERYNVTQFQNLLLRSLSKFIKDIYKEGATILAVNGVPPFGCLPSQITLQNITGNTCVDEYNAVAVSFNKKIAALVEGMKPTVPGLKLAYIDVYDKLLDMIHHPRKYGFKEVRRGCCGSGFMEFAYSCNAMCQTCSDASKYVFWDAVHPTTRAYGILAHSTLSQARSLMK